MIHPIQEQFYGSVSWSTACNVASPASPIHQGTEGPTYSRQREAYRRPRIISPHARYTRISYRPGMETSDDVSDLDGSHPRTGLHFGTADLGNNLPFHPCSGVIRRDGASPLR